MFRRQLHLQHLCVATIEFAEQISLLARSSEFLALPSQLMALAAECPSLPKDEHGGSAGDEGEEAPMIGATRATPPNFTLALLIQLKNH
jgi:hypothetical protein